MNVSRRFIDYPVMTTLVMAAIVIFGLVGYFTLPVNELPNVDFPTISVQANLAGADPETMASAVAAPLENVFTTRARHRLDDLDEQPGQHATSRFSSGSTVTSTRRRRTCRPRCRARCANCRRR